MDAMYSLDVEVIRLNAFSKKNRQRMCQENAEMEVVERLTRKGRYYALENISAHARGVRNRKNLLKAAVATLVPLINTSHDGKNELGKSEFRDVFCPGPDFSGHEFGVKLCRRKGDWNVEEGRSWGCAGRAGRSA